MDLRATLTARWDALGHALGAAPAAWRPEGRALLRNWSRWPRRYHDLRHLQACLRHFDDVRAELADPVAVELALWFHDAVYWPWSRRNEAASADLADAFLARCGWGADRISRVRQLVMDTCHAAAPATDDGVWLVDIDLAILGADRAVYLGFERDVHQEYRWFVRWRTWTTRRAALLQQFLDRPQLYGTPWFQARREAAARNNLAHAITALRAGRMPG